MTHKEMRVDNQDDHNQVSLNDHSKGSEKDQEAFTTNNDDEEAVAAKNPNSEEFKVNEKLKRT